MFTKEVIESIGNILDYLPKLNRYLVLSSNTYFRRIFRWKFSLYRNRVINTLGNNHEICHWHYHTIKWVQIRYIFTFTLWVNKYSTSTINTLTQYSWNRLYSSVIIIELEHVFTQCETFSQFGRYWWHQLISFTKLCVI